MRHIHTGILPTFLFVLSFLISFGTSTNSYAAGATPTLNINVPTMIENTGFSIGIDYVPFSKFVLFASTSGLDNKGRLINPVLWINDTTDPIGEFTISGTVPLGMAGMPVYLQGWAKASGYPIASTPPLPVTILGLGGGGGAGGPADFIVPADGTLESVISKAKAGDVIEVSGVTPKVKISGKSGTVSPIIVQSSTGAIIQANTSNGSSSINFDNGADNIQFYNMTIECDDTMAINFPGKQGGFSNNLFDGCKIGQASGKYWNFETNSGFNGKWGILPYELDNFVFRNGEIIGIFEEHCIYSHNARAASPTSPAVLIENTTLKWAGRTAAQFTARTHEGPTGQGSITILNSNIEDVCVQDGGGGHALTFAGNHLGTVTIDGTTVKLGCNKNLHPEYQPDITGSIQVHSGDGAAGRGTTEIIVKNSHFEVGQFYVGSGSARRPNVDIGNCARLEIGPSVTIKQWPGAAAALQIRTGSIGVGADINTGTITDSRGSVTLWKNNTVIGDVTIGGNTYKDPNYNGAGYAAALAAVANDPQFVIK